MRIYHQEEQRFFNFDRRVLLILLITVLLLLWVFIQDVELLYALGASAILIFIVFFFLSSMKLYLEINSTAVKYKYLPLIRKWRTIEGINILETSVEKYQWLKYGGWGYRTNLKNMAYTVFSNDVVKIKKKDDNNLLLSTRMPESAKDALRRMLNENKHG